MITKYLQRGLSVAGLATLATFAACGDEFLDREPLTSYTAANFPRNAQQIEQAIIPGYNALRELYAQNLWVLGEMRSDNTTFTFSAQDQGLQGRWQTDLFVDGASVDRSADAWNDLYRAIQRMNVVLVNIGDADFEDEDLRTQREAEARFLRGFFYWQLARNFGDAPLLLEPEYDQAALLAIRRAPVDELYAQAIIPDVTFAIDNLPATYLPGGPDVGRATRGAAQMLLAKAHFLRRDYAAALPLLEALIDEGQYALFPDFRGLFAPENENNAEIIFAAQFENGANQGAGFLNSWLPLGSGTTISGNPRQNIGSSGGGNNRPTDCLFDAYEEGDPRREATIGVAQIGGQRVLWPRKFIFPPIPDGGLSTDWPVFRYADVLLMRSEALLELGTQGELPDQVFLDINELRGRVGLDLAFPGSPDSILNADTPDKLRGLLRLERRREMALEDYRWYDLVRYGNVVEVMRAHGARQRAIGGYIDNFSDAFENIPELYPLPINQVQTYGYRQNPGY